MARTRPGCRPFTILDGMILIAATAVGTAWSRNIWLAMKSDWLSGNGWVEKFIKLPALALPLLIFWTISQPILRLRKPRPSWRKVARQPGMAACMAIILTLVLSSLLVVAILVRLFQAGGNTLLRFLENVTGSLADILIIVPPFAGLAVIVSWMMLVLQRQWRNEPGWIDRMGRAVGVLWIIEMVILDVFWVQNFW